MAQAAAAAAAVYIRAALKKTGRENGWKGKLINAVKGSQPASGAVRQ